MNANSGTIWDTSKTWGEMRIVQKLVFMGKFTLAMATFGFAFPHVLS